MKIWIADDPRYPDRKHETAMEIKVLSEDGWHFRVTKRPSGVIYVLAHFHGATSYLAWAHLRGSPMMRVHDSLLRCIECKQEPPEAIQMVLKLQRLGGR